MKTGRELARCQALTCNTESPRGGEGAAGPQGVTPGSSAVAWSSHVSPMLSLWWCRARRGAEQGPPRPQRTELSHQHFHSLTRVPKKRSHSSTGSRVCPEGARSFPDRRGTRAVTGIYTGRRLVPALPRTGQAGLGTV